MELQKLKPGYKLFKLSEHSKVVLSIIPEEWETTTLGSITDPITKGTTPTTEGKKFTNSGVLFFKVESILDRGNLDITKTSFITKDTHQKLKRSQLKENDILFTIAGTLGRIGRIRKEHLPANINQAIAIIRIKENNYNHDFLEYFLRSMPILKQIFIEKTIMAQPNLSLTQVSHLKIIQLEVSEQLKIAAILSNVDSLIKQTQKVIESIKRLKKGLMQQLFTKGIGHTKFKKVELGRKFLKMEIPNEWKLSKLNDFASVHGRIGWKNLRADEYTETGHLMLSVWSLVKSIPYGIDYSEGVKRLNQFRYDESPEIKIQNDDVLIAKDGDIGRLGFVKKLPESSTVNSHVVIVRVLKNYVNPQFLYWFMSFKLFQSYCIAFTSGTTIPLLTQKDLKNSIIPIPLLKEQNKIASIISEVDSKIPSLELSKSDLINLKKGLMQKLLTGQIRV